jgi:hypothetical protein
LWKKVIRNRLGLGANRQHFGVFILPFQTLLYSTSRCMISMGSTYILKRSNRFPQGDKTAIAKVDIIRGYSPFFLTENFCTLTTLIEGCQSKQFGTLANYQLLRASFKRKHSRVCMKSIKKVDRYYLIKSLFTRK